jgi:hypothetical protein
VGEYSQVEAPAIAVSDGVIYIAGTYNSEGTWYSCYWKNGVRTDISATDRYARTMAVKGNNVFMAGWGINSESAWYSKNTSVYSVTATGNSSADAITVSGNDVYVTGYYNGGGSTSTACYWKNGTRVSLLENASANAVFVIANQPTPPQSGRGMVVLIRYRTRV